MGLKNLMILGFGIALIGGLVTGTHATEDSRASKTQSAQVDAKTLAKHIGYTFRDSIFIDQVFTHAGVAPDNQVPFGRLEFLGDGALDWVVTRRLMAANPTQGEGWLTQKKATIVSNENNAAVFDRLQLFPFVRLNPVHQVDGKGLQKIKADTCEALIGAIYQDGGQESAEKFIMTYWLSNDMTNGVKNVLTKGVQKGAKSTAAPVVVVQSTSSKAGSASSATAPLKAKEKPAVSAPSKATVTSASKPQGFTVVGDVKAQLEAFRQVNNLPSPTYKWTSKKVPYRGQLTFCDQPFTAVYEGSTKSAVKKLCASQVLRIFHEAKFSERLQGKSKQQVAKLLIELSAETTGQGPKSEAVAKVGAVPKTNTPFSETVSLKKSKQRLQDLCVHLHQGAPVYTVLDGATTSTATVTIEGVGTFEASGNKAQKHAALAAYTKITGEVIGLKEVKKALNVLCQEKHYGKPVYTSGKEEIRVRVTVDDFSEEAVSNQSKDHAEKEAAKKLYEALRKAKK